jgi:hypothetical protein
MRLSFDPHLKDICEKFIKPIKQNIILHLTLLGDESSIGKTKFFVHDLHWWWLGLGSPIDTPSHDPHVLRSNQTWSLWLKASQWCVTNYNVTSRFGSVLIHFLMDEFLEAYNNTSLSDLIYMVMFSAPCCHTKELLVYESRSSVFVAFQVREEVPRLRPTCSCLWVLVWSHSFPNRFASGNKSTSRKMNGPTMWCHVSGVHWAL